MWELEERHLQEKHQLHKQQLKDQYFMQRHQLLKRHEKVTSQSYICSSGSYWHEFVFTLNVFLYRKWSRCIGITSVW